MNCREVLPKFFGFEGIGILFRDHLTDKLFSIEQDEKEGDEELMKLKQRKSRLKQQLTQQEAV